MQSLTSRNVRPLFVYVVDVPMSKRDAKRFGLETVRAAGYEVEIWDIGTLSFPLYNRRDIDRHLEDHQRIFDSYKDFASMCKRLGPKDVLFCFAGVRSHERFSHRKLRAALSSSTCTVCTISSGHTPVDTAHAPLLARILRGAKDPRRFIRFLNRQVIQKALSELFGRVDWGVDYVFYGTKNSIDPRLIKDSTRTVPIHALDFDWILDKEHATLANQAISPRTVYIDSLGPVHPDLTAFNIDLRYSSQVWFQRISRILHHVTDVDRTQPVVAGHPRGIGSSIRERYAPYEVVFGKTADLVEGAELVVGEVSASLWLAAWYKKPLALIWMPGIADWYDRATENFQKALDCEVWDATANPSTWSRPKVNEQKYEDYIRNYVKLPGTPMRRFWDVVLGSLNPEDRLRVHKKTLVKAKAHSIS